MVENITPSLFAAQLFDSPSELAAALAPIAAPGHFDELRGSVSVPGGLKDALSASADGAESLSPLSENWTRFFNFLGTEGFQELNQRSGNASASWATTSRTPPR